MNKQKQWKQSLLEFIRFGLVGFSGIFVDLLVLVLCREVLQLDERISVFPAFLLAVSWNYELNRRFTFDSKGVLWFKGYIRFLLVGLSGLVVRFGVMHLLIQGAGFTADQYLSWGEWIVPYIRLSYLASFLGILVAYFFNFAGSKFFAFQKEQKSVVHKEKP